jgi:hypothetical protein
MSKLNPRRAIVRGSSCGHARFSIPHRHPMTELIRANPNTTLIRSLFGM